MFLLEKVQILPVGMSRHNATTYAVIRIFVNIPVEKKLYEKLGTVLLKFQSYTKKACKTQIDRLTKPSKTDACHCTELR